MVWSQSLLRRCVVACVAGDATLHGFSGPQSQLQLQLPPQLQARFARRRRLTPITVKPNTIPSPSPSFVSPGLH